MKLRLQPVNATDTELTLSSDNKIKKDKNKSTGPDTLVTEDTEPEEKEAVEKDTAAEEDTGSEEELIFEEDLSLESDTMKP